MSEQEYTKDEIQAKFRVDEEAVAKFVERYGSEEKVQDDE